MTGTGIHLLDAFVNAGGPFAEVQAQVLAFRKGPDPRDAASVMIRFANGLSGYFGLVRASPFYWRVQVFGDDGSVEAIGETEVVVRTKGGKAERREFPKIDSLLYEIDAFADAVGKRAPYPITPQEMVNTIAAFEAIIRSMNTGKPVTIA
jgi:predicted dehydrogenase